MVDWSNEVLDARIASSSEFAAGYDAGILKAREVVERHGPERPPEGQAAVILVALVICGVWGMVIGWVAHMVIM